MARKRLATGQGSLINRTETLKRLGVQTSKSLPVSVTALQEQENTMKTDHSSVHQVNQ